MDSGFVQRCKLGTYPGEGAQEVQQNPQNLYGNVSLSSAVVVQSA